MRLVQRKPNRKKVSKSIGLVSWTGEDSEPWKDKPSLQQTDGGVTGKNGHEDSVCSPLPQEASQRKAKENMG